MNDGYTWRSMDSAPMDGTVIVGGYFDTFGDNDETAVRYANGLWLHEGNPVPEPDFWRSVSD